MFSKFDFERNIWKTYTPQGTPNELDQSNIMDGSDNSFDTRQIGLNFEPSAGLKVENVIVTLGFRLQWMRTQFVDEPVIGNTKFAPSGWMNDYFYGMVVGFMYTF